ncbi:MAG: hypothetical protein AB2794_18935 [Candidatus Thiodiazotropha endolucinida]
MPRRQKRKNKSTPSPPNKPTLTKKLKQAGNLDDSQSESDYIDAEERLYDNDNFTDSLPYLQSSQDTQLSQEINKIVDQGELSIQQTMNETTLSAQSTASTVSAPVVTVSETTATGLMSDTGAHGDGASVPLNDSLNQPQSQSLLQGEVPIAGAFHSSTPVHVLPGMSTMSQLPMTLQPSQMMPMPMPHTQMPILHNTLSDNDVLRVAVKVKAIMMEEINTLVNLKVDQATAQMRGDIELLKNENLKLRSDVKKLESTCKSNIDDLEQYSRRACLRISGINEEEGENTDDIVLNLATRVSADVRLEDLDRSHRVGRPRPADPTNNTVPKPREIIVKFSNSKARLSLLKGRAELRRTRAKIFINEDLTSARKELAYKCRCLQRDRLIKKVWTYNGNIFIQTLNDAKVQISAVSDLDSYRNADSNMD